MIGILYKPKLHFRRFEFKYVVNEQNLDKIRRSVSNFVEVDPSAKKSSDNSYQVKSLYFDDVSYTTYYEKIAGLKLKNKLRLRTYDLKTSAKVPIFVEFKKRDDAIVLKDRFVSDYKTIKEVLFAGRYELLPGGDQEKISNLFLHFVLRRSFRPVILITYKREAYFDRNNSNFRITLDQDIRAKKNLDLNFDTSDLSAVLPGYAILEAKFNRVMPAWFGLLIKTYNLNRVSFSKYCFSLESCGIVNKSERPYLPQEWTY